MTKRKIPKPDDNINKKLEAIAGKIRSLEKNNVANVIEIGRQFELAEKQCERGDYMDWVQSIGWSHSTSLNCRSVYRLQHDRKICDLRLLNISVSAVYLLAHNIERLPIRDAIIEAAMKGRVSFSMAKQIITDHEAKVALEQAEAEEAEAERAKAEREVDQMEDDPATIAYKKWLDEQDVPVARPTPSPSVSASPTPAAPAPAPAPDITMLLHRLHAALLDPETDVAMAIAAVGRVDVHEIIDKLKAAIDELSSDNAIKAKADRAEAKLRMN